MLVLAALFLALPTLPAQARGVLTQGGGGVGAITSAMSSSIVSAQQAAAATVQSQNSLARVTQAIMAMQRMQSAARSLALAAPNTVPDGLVAGGLVPDSGLASPGVANPVKDWIGANTPAQARGGGVTTVTVLQTAQKAILSWSSLNVGKNTDLVFDQKAGTAADGSNDWVALNRVLDPSGVPSQILGSIKADGSVYLLNDNGIIFGGGAQVNVNTLIASSLDLFSANPPASDSAFLDAGIGDQGFLQNNTNVILTSLAAGRGPITIDEGASITARDLGLVLIAAPNVTNHGEIFASDGQAALIAGTGVSVLFGDGVGNEGLNTISPSSDELVFFNYSTLGNNATMPGTLFNDGLVESLRGDATLVGGVVEQDGVVESTTSVTRPGSIEIEGSYGDTLNSGQSGGFAIQQTGLTGPVSFGPGAVTTILPDADGATVPTAAASTVQFGQITLTGSSLDFQNGSLTYAPGQSIQAMALPQNWINSMNFPADAPVGLQRILIESGAVIDVSGIPDVELPATGTFYTEKLNGNDLADSPLQRNGFLYGRAITVNTTISGTRADGLAWVGTPLANLSGYAGLIPQSIAEILTNAGSLALSGGEVDLALGGVINLMGGYVNALGGNLNTTRLVDASGHIYDIAQADPDDLFVGFAGQFTETHPKWGVSQSFENPLIAGDTYQPGYITGGNAGALSVAVQVTEQASQDIVFPPGAGAIVLDGAIEGASFAGLHQVDDAAIPKNASLSINTAFPVEIGASTVLSPAAAAAATLPEGYNADSPLLASYPPGEAPLPFVTGAQPPPSATTPFANPYLNANVLLSDVLDNDDFNSISIESTKGAMTEDADTALSVQPGGTITLNGTYVAINGDLTARGGTINLNTNTAGFGAANSNVPYLAPEPEPFDTISVADGAKIDVSGLFVNDTGALANELQAETNENGGAIALTVAGGETMDAKGGGHDATGNIVLAPGSLLDLSGGGIILPSGKLLMRGDLPAGAGGSLSLLIAGGFSSEKKIPQQAALVIDGTINALGFSGGGNLSLGALSFQIGGDANPALRPADAFYFNPSQWGAAGFANFSLQAAYNAVIPDNAVINLQHDNLLPDYASITSAPSGADVQAYSTVGLLPLGLRAPTDLSVDAGLQHQWLGGDVSAYTAPANFLSGGGADTVGLKTLDQLVVGAGAAITGDPLADITLSAVGAVSIYSRIAAPGGTVSLTSSGYFDTADNTTVSNLLYLAPQASIDVAGAAIPTPDAQPVPSGDGGLFTPATGTVLAGGTVTLTDYWGPLVVAPGATLDVSGAAANFDVAQQALAQAVSSTPSYLSEPDWSDAGAVNFNGAVALLFQGTLIGQPGAPEARGGTLTINQEGANNAVYNNSGETPFMPGTPAVVLVQDTAAAVTAAANGAYRPYYVPLNDRPGMKLAAVSKAAPSLLFGVDSLDNSGFDNLVITEGAARGGTTLAYSGAVTLSLGGSFMATNLIATNAGGIPFAGILALPAGNLDAGAPKAKGDGSLTLSARYIELSGYQPSFGSSNGSSALPAGDGQLSLSADEVDLAGAVGIGDVAQASITSQTSLRLLPYQSDAYYATDGGLLFGQNLLGGLTTTGNLTLDAAQIYPATDTIFLIVAAGPNPTSVTFGYPAQVGAATSVPLSAGGSIIVDATNIAQGGNLVAPFGQIALGDNDATPGGAPTPGALSALINLSADLQSPPPVVTKTVDLLAGGITSVSGAGALIPYGSTVDGTTWLYDPQVNTVNAAGTNTTWTAPLTAPPAKYIAIAGTKIAIGAGATIDIAGGGDLQAAEWIAGTGGSRNLLLANNLTYSSTGVASTVPLYPDNRPVYAILPNDKGNTAPYDPYIDEGLGDSAAGEGNAAGEAVYLSGVPGLAAGVYTLLPGLYATLPGAYRVVQVTGVNNPLASQLITEPDGTVQAAGYFVNQLTGTRASGTSEFLVQSAAVWGQYSQYALSSANSFFPALAAATGAVTPPLPTDAGHLVLGETTTTSLQLQGTTLSNPASAAALAAQIDIVAENIQITGGGAAALPGYLQIDAQALDDLGAGSLLIGGTRSSAATGETITPQAANIVVSNSAGTPLEAPEILLVATPTIGTVTITLDTEGDQATVPVPKPGTGKVTLQSGSVVIATGVAGRSPPEIFGGSLAMLPVLPNPVYVSQLQLFSFQPGIFPPELTQYYTMVETDLGSILQVSDGAPVKAILPTLAQLNPAVETVIDNVDTANPDYALDLPAIAFSGGVTVAAGASVEAANTLTLAGGEGSRIAGGATLGAPNIFVESSAITFAGGGATMQAGQPAANAAIIDPAMLSSLKDTQDITFESAGAINFDGDVTLALASGTLDLSAGSFVESDGGQTVISAPTVALTNNFAAPATAAPLPPTAALTIHASVIELGPGEKAATGLAAFTADATGDILGAGAGSLDVGGAAVALAAPIIIAGGDSAQTLTTTGTLSATAIPGGAVNTAQPGGAITLIGASITDTASIDAAAGNVTLEATKGDVVVGSGVVIDVSALARNFYDVTRYAPAGVITLTADVGSVLVQLGALLDFSATKAGGGDAGSLNVTAAMQNANLAGAIAGGAAAGYAGGSFTLDAGGAQNLGTLAGLLTSAGVTGGVSVTTGAGDLVLDTRLAARAVGLTASGGTVMIGDGGEIDASGAAGGEIDLYGSGGVDVEGALLANGTALSQPGGRIELGTTGVWNGTLNPTYAYENIATSGAIAIGSAAILDVSGGTLGGNAGGSVTLRAPLLTNGTVNVTISPSAIFRNGVIGGGTPSRGTALDVYAVWSTTDGGPFDGIIDPAGWYDSGGNLVAGTFTPQSGHSFAYTPGSLTAAQLSADLTNDYFQPATYNAAHAVFYGGYDPNTQVFDPAAPDANSLPAFIQNPGFAFGTRFAGLSNFQARPEVDLVNPSKTVNGGNISVLTNWDLGAGTCANAACTEQTLAYRYQGTVAPVIRVAAQGNVLIDASISDGFFLSQGIRPPAPPNATKLADNDQAASAIFMMDENKIFTSQIVIFNDQSSTSIGLIDPNTTEAAPDPGGSTLYYENYQGNQNLMGYITDYDLWSAYFNDFNTAYDHITNGMAPAPSPADYRTYTAYINAYQAYLTATFTSINSGTPPAPAAPTTLANYPTYLNEYESDYSPYVYSLQVYDSTDTFLTASPYVYAPVAPPFQVAPPVVPLPAPPNLPSNMATRASPLPVAFATLMAGQSASYTIVAGAALASANPRAAVAGAGDVVLDDHVAYADKISGLTVTSPTTVRTGTGSIDIDAGGGIALADQTAPGVIYTAGVPAPGTGAGGGGSWVTVGNYQPGSSGQAGSTIVVTDPVNPEGAGDVTLNAAGDITGSEQVFDQTGVISGVGGDYIGQTWSSWLTAGPGGGNIGWYVNFAGFDEGIMSLGGNVSVTAGGNITDLAVSLPTSSYITTASNAGGITASLKGSNLVYVGGGILSVRAGGDIRSGDYYVGQGSGTLQAGGAIGSDFNYTVLNGFFDAPSAGNNALAPLLAVQNASLAVQSREDADIGGVFDPTDLSGPGGLALTSMTAASSVIVSAASGDIDFNSFAYMDSLVFGLFNTAFLDTPDTPSTLLPASLSLTAFAGGIDIDRGGGLFPSATGELSLIADQSVSLNSGSGLGSLVGNIPGNVLELLDYPLNTGILPNALNPATLQLTSLSANDAHDPTLLHTGDTQPVIIYSLTGDITDGQVNTDGSGADNLLVEPDKPAEIRAAGNLTDLAFLGENLNPADITLITAGQDIVNLPLSTSNASQDIGSPPVLELAGPGDFAVEAGGNISFTSQRVLLQSEPTGFSQSDIETGIRTIGNSIDLGPEFFQGGSPTNSGGGFGDPYLPEGGATVSVLFGIGPGINEQGFVSQYANPANAAAVAPEDLGFLTALISSYETSIGNTEHTNLTASQAWALFQTLPPNRQFLLAQLLFFQILNNVGLDYNLASSPNYHQYQRGYAAINTLFPASYGYTANGLNGGTNGANVTVDTGNLDLRDSTIQTQQGGGISLVGPGGSILVGTKAPPPTYVQPFSEGVITIERGDINTFSDGNVEVAQSRVVTEQGGNIIMWTSNGNLDAGKGAKTSLSFPLPVYSCDNDYYCTQDADGLVTGAGIATLQTLPNSPLGNADLIAPRGTVDAGAAGVRVSGNLNIAALHVENAFNIQAQGTVAGVPTASSPNVTALTSVSNAAGAAIANADAAAQQGRQAPLPTIWIVEVLGYGGNGAAPDNNSQPPRHQRKRPLTQASLTPPRQQAAQPTDLF